MAAIEGIPTKNDEFSFEDWLTSSGLRSLQDILIKHNMTTIEALSTESLEFASFISDPLLLPRAMLIPQTIQSLQQLQQNAYKYKQKPKEKEPNNNNIKNNPEIQEQQQQQQKQTNTKNENNNYNIDSDNSSDADPNSLFNRYKQYKRDKAKHRQESQTEIASVETLINNASKPSIIRENSNNKKKRKMVKLKLGDHVRFVNSKKRQGIVRFIGETEFADGIWYGIQLTEGEIGDCDGSIDGVEYFTCSQNMGVFVKRKILRRIKPPNTKQNKSNKNSPKRIAKSKTTKKQLTDRDKWRNKIQKKKKKRKNNKRPATLGAADFSSMFSERTSSKKKNDEYYKKMRQELKKQGPRDIGKIKYKGIKPTRKKKQKKKKLSMNDIDRSALPIIQPKLGPRDIGKIKYNGLKLSKKQKEDLGLVAGKNKFLDENLSHSTRKLKKFGSKEDLFGVKLGPQEIGKIKYKGTKLSRKQKEELRKGNVLEERIAHSVKKKKKLHRRSKSLVGSKLGPIEMGKNDDYIGTKMVYNDDDGKDILREKTHVVIKKKWHIKKDDMDMDYSDGSYNSDGIGTLSDLDIGSDEKDSGIDSDSEDLENALSLKPKKKRPLTAKKYGKSTDSSDRFGGKRGRKKKDIKGLKIKKDTTKSSPTLQKVHSSPTSPASIHISTPKGKSKNGFKPETPRKRKKKNKTHNKKDKKKGKKKRKKKKDKNGGLGLAEFERYKSKLNVRELNKSETSPAPRHYASESDQEYIETMKNNSYYNLQDSLENDKQINNQPTTPITPITPLVIETEKDENKPITPVSLKHEEIAHYVHVDPTESDTDNESMAGSLNALSSEEDILEINYNNTEANKWI